MPGDTDKENTSEDSTNYINNISTNLENQTLTANQIATQIKNTLPHIFLI